MEDLCQILVLTDVQQKVIQHQLNLTLDTRSLPPTHGKSTSKLKFDDIELNQPNIQRTD
jgi:hypothetical protein